MCCLKKIMTLVELRANTKLEVHFMYMNELLSYFHLDFLIELASFQGHTALFNRFSKDILKCCYPNYPQSQKPLTSSVHNVIKLHSISTDPNCLQSWTRTHFPGVEGIQSICKCQIRLPSPDQWKNGVDQ